MQTLTYEAQRLAALDACRMLHNGPEPVFERLTRLAAQFFSAPIAVISLVGRERVVVKSGLGINVTGNAATVPSALIPCLAEIRS